MADTSNIEAMSDDEILATEPTPVEEGEEQEVPNSSGSDEDPSQGDDGSEELEDSTGDEASEASVDYEQFYKALTSPIKADGREIQLRNPEEIIKLVQMGANYTRKTQEMAGVRKKLHMLERANLLDDNRLNFMIDLASGNQDAIRKLLQEKGIDPLDLDLRDNSQYVPTNHSVSDQEMQFVNVVEDLKSTPEGIQTISFARDLDNQSMQEITQDPSLLATLHEQRQNGVFNLITQEMQHQSMLGNLPPTMSFLQAYKAVGDYLLQNAQQNYAQQTQNLPQGMINKPVNQTTASIRSAAPSGRSRKAATSFVDPFTMSDEEFEKQFANLQ